MEQRSHWQEYVEEFLARLGDPDITEDDLGECGRCGYPEIHSEMRNGLCINCADEMGG